MLFFQRTQKLTQVENEDETSALASLSVGLNPRNRVTRILCSPRHNLSPASTQR